MSAARPRTVLHVVDTVNRSGLLPRTVELMSRLDPSEFRLVFCALAGGPGAFDHEIRSLGGQVYHCRLGPSFPRAFFLLLRQLRPSVVHSWARTSTGTVLGLARMARVRRRVAHLHDSLGGRGSGPVTWLGRAVDRGLIDAGATDLLAVSETTIRRFWCSQWRADPRCRVIYDGLAVEPFGVAIAARRRALEAAPAGVDIPITMLHTGRLATNDTGRLRPVEILAALSARGADARLRLVGPQEPAETAALLAAAVRHDVRDRVELLGERDDIPRLLVAASLLLVTSDRESLPSAVPAACAVGTPVLSADLAGVGEISRLLPGITMLPLSAADGLWADAARALTDVPPSLDDRRAALRHFVRSPFTIENWQRELTAIWSGSLSTALPALRGKS
ncbi:glycosyltransferase [Frankia sp. Cj3]|uniref:glycosyltransferase n=1 Tax=Frankia sp. Cj3 TaxID=2880976 RepID=UPI001EF6506C|nr:glycosyltransferase [Frankia sp. Cj3]